MIELIRITLAIVLLATEVPVEPGMFPLVSRELRSIALSAELMGQREVRYVFASAKELLPDVLMIRIRAKQLEDAPRTIEAVRFAPFDRDTFCELLQFNRRYMSYLNECRILFPSNESISIAIEENAKHYLIWDLLRDAKTGWYYVHIRRQALAKLRAMIGKEAFEHGVMPPHVPLWRFVEVRP